MASMMQSVGALSLPGLSTWIDRTAITGAASTGIGGSIGAAVGGAGAGAGAAAGIAAGGASGALAPSSDALSALQGGATISAMAAKLIGGLSKLQQGFAAADMADLEAEQRAIAIRREAVKKVGAARVAYAASGLDISSGGELEASMQQDADFQVGLARAGGKVAAANATSRGVAGLGGSLVEAGGRWTEYQLSLAKRG